MGEKKDTISFIFGLYEKKLRSKPSDNHQLLHVTGLSHPYTPNILFLITLRCICACCLRLFAFLQSGTHSYPWYMLSLIDAHALVLGPTIAFDAHMCAREASRTPDSSRHQTFRHLRDCLRSESSYCTSRHTYCSPACRKISSLAVRVASRLVGISSHYPSPISDDH